MRMHCSLIERSADGGVKSGRTPADGIEPDISLAEASAGVVQGVSHTGSPPPSTSGADNFLLIRDRHEQDFSGSYPVHRVPEMSATSALDWPENERAYAALIPQIALGDERAMARLYDSTSRIAYGLSLRIVNDPSAAEDVTLEAYLQVWRTAESYDPGRGTVTGWLLTVVRSRAIDWLRARKARRADLELDFDEVFDLQDLRPSPERSSIDAGRSRIIQEAMAELPVEQKRALELTYFAGLSHSEIAAETGLPIGTVKTRIRLGMIRLRELLGPYAEGL
jgi:RNA polymerase sigma-70 factor, ECF subfamily